MKIIFVTLGKANPDRLNGVNKIVHQAATEMAHRQLDIEVWGITANLNNADRQTDYPLKLFLGKARSFILLGSLKKSIASLPKDTIVHFHGALIPIYFSMVRFLAAYDIDWVLTPHAALLPRSLLKNYWLKYFYRIFFDHYVLKQSQAIHAITDEEATELKKLGYSNVVQIPNAYRDDAIVQTKNHNESIVFGFVGRLHLSQKGLDALLHGFALFYKNKGYGALWLVGDGPDRMELQKLAEVLGIAKAVHFFGACFGEDKRARLQGMDVFISPARWDVLPTAVLEAAWHQLPLIVSHASGFSDAIRHYQAGLVIAETDANAIYKAMLQYEDLFQQDKLRDIGKNAERMVKEEYSWDIVIPQYLRKLYKKTG